MTAEIIEFPSPVTHGMAQSTTQATVASEKKSNHQVKIVRIEELLPHTNADSLSLVHIGGYQLVVRKGQFAVGDLAVFIQPDSVVPQTEPFKFIWETYVGLDGKVPENRRRITVRKFRGEYSEGLLLPLSDFTTQEQIIDFLPQEGDDVSDLIGVTHYDPDAGTESTKGEQMHAPRRKFRYPRTFMGWVRFLSRLFVSRVLGKKDKSLGTVPFTVPTYDVEAFKNYANTFDRFEPVVVSEKIHGSNARFLFLDGIMYAGSRSQWKAPGSNDVWNKALAQNPWIEQWCRAHEGYTLYGEVTPTQKAFDYGTSNVQFFMFDIYTPEKTWLDFDSYGIEGFNIEVFNSHMVPILYYGPFIPERIMSLVDGPSEVEGAKHMREGIVIRTTAERTHRGLGRAQLKVVSNSFLEKDLKVTSAA